MINKTTPFRRTACAAAMLTWSISGVAGVSHFLPGMMNIRDFLVPEKEGVYSALYLGNYSTSELTDTNGNAIQSATFQATKTLGPGIPAGASITANIDAEVEMYLIAPTFVWNTGYRIFGADYAMLISIPFANTSVGASLDTLTNINLANRAASLNKQLSVDDSTFNVSDIFVQPLMLGWHGKHYDVSTAYGFYAPSGKYDTSDIANTGLGFWGHQFQLAGAYYPFDHKGTALMLAGTYEVNHETQGKDFTQGGHFTLNWGMSQFLPITDNVLLEIGPAGYSQWQVQDNHGADQSSFLNSPNQVHAVGGQIGLALPKADTQFIFHYFTEFEAESRFRGNYAGFTAATKFLAMPIFWFSNLEKKMINRSNYKKVSLIATVFCFLAALPAQAQLMIYPMKGQTNEQLSKDRYECHLWAVQQSGFDPTNAQATQQTQSQAQTPQTQPGGQVLRGGMRGAAMGAAVGAIAGDAGKGAAIGATAGGIRGGFKHLDKNTATTTPTYQSAPGQDAYNQAIKACLSGRSYSVN